MYNCYMKIIKLEEIDSTHLYLKEYISKNGYIEPLCIVTDLQTNGIGSRGNSWQGKKIIYQSIYNIILSIKCINVRETNK